MLSWPSLQFGLDLPMSLAMPGTLHTAGKQLPANAFAAVQHAASTYKQLPGWHLPAQRCPAYPSPSKACALR